MPSADTGFRAYLRTFLSFDPAAVVRGVILDLAVAATEGLGLFMLLPLLALAGVVDTNASGGLTVPGWLGWLGIGWTLEAVLVLFVALIVCQTSLTYLRDRESAALNIRFGDHLRTRLFSAMARSSWSFLSSRHSAGMVGVLGGEVQRISAGTYFLLRLFTVAMMTSTYLLVALWLSAGLTLLALLGGGVIWWMLRRNDAAVAASGALVSGANQRLFTLVQEFLSALKLVKAHGEEEADIARFTRAVEAASQGQIAFRAVYVRTQGLYRIVGAISLASICYVAIVVLALPPARILVLMAIFARLLPRLSEVQGHRQQILHMLPAYVAWRRLLDDCTAQPGSPMTDGCPQALGQAIEFDQVRFQHPQSHHRLAVDRLRIPVGTTTAVVGASGAGKTTLIDLLCGLLQPDEGDIRIDGCPLARRPGWQRGIAYIPQETLIMSGTLRDNLQWGGEAVSDADIHRALDQAALTALVGRLPRGLDTEVGERGVKLSGGEKQRLALARALLRRPVLLVLDEATNALDADSHRLIVDTLRRWHGQLTIVLVSHRLEELDGLVDGYVDVVQGDVAAWRPA